MDFEQENTKVKRSLLDYKIIARRRRKPMIVFFTLMLMAGLATTFFLPARYSSQAVILIEEQDVPKDLVQSTITTYAVQRIEEIKQKIMTVSNIMDIVEKFGVYNAKELKRFTRTEVASQFRKNVSIEPISADVVDPRSGRPTQTVIAFKLTFHGEDPSVVHKVTNELVTLYLNENQKERTEQSTSTSVFLRGEAKALDEELKKLERQISDFKDMHQGALPELNTFNLGILDRSERELIDINTRLQLLDTRKIEISSQLIQLNPSSPTILANGQAILGDSDRLQALEAEYRAKSAIYQLGHPDLRRLEREINKLKSTTQQDDEWEGTALQLSNTKKLLNEKRQRYQPDHPEVLRLQALAEKLKEQLDNTPKLVSELTPDNPAYILLESQLQSVEVEKVSLFSKRKLLEEKIASYEKRLLKAPSVEKDYQALLRDYENTRLKYRAIESKQLQAELGKNLESERKGERFTLIQPPEIPEKADSPNRLALTFVSIFLAIASAIAVGVTAEMVDQNVYGINNITAITGLTPLMTIPDMPREKSKINRRLGSYLLILGVIFMFCLGALLFHLYVKPLDVTWYILLRKFGLLV